MGIIAAGLSSAFGLSGEKPRVPKAPRLDFGKETAASLAEDTANLPAADAFVREFNRLSTEQGMAAMEQLFPGYGQMLQRGADTYGAMGRGELPASEYSKLERRLAEKGVSIGTAGSQFGDVGVERERLGIDLAYIDKGLQSYQAWTSGAASGIPKTSMENVFLPTSAKIGIRANEEQFGWQRDWLANQIHAMQSPEQKMWQDALGQEESSISSLAGSMVGYGGGSASGGSSGGGGGL